jgi:hypothetical protein
MDKKWRKPIFKHVLTSVYYFLRKYLKAFLLWLLDGTIWIALAIIAEAHFK